MNEMNEDTIAAGSDAEAPASTNAWSVIVYAAKGTHEVHMALRAERIGGRWVLAPAATIPPPAVLLAGDDAPLLRVLDALDGLAPSADAA